MQITMYGIRSCHDCVDAEKLLNETWLSIAEITERCGYTSPNTFSKAFKRCTGVAPVALQRTKKPKAAN